MYGSYATGGSWGHLGPPPQRPEVVCLSSLPPKRLIGVIFLQLWMIFFTDERCQKTLTSQIQAMFLPFFEVQNFYFSSKSQNVTKIECLRIQYRFKINFHALKNVNFCSTSNDINFCHILMILLGSPLPVENRTFFSIFFRKWIFTTPKNSGLNPWSF